MSVPGAILGTLFGVGKKVKESVSQVKNINKDVELQQSKAIYGDKEDGKGGIIGSFKDRVTGLFGAISNKFSKGVKDKKGGYQKSIKEAAGDMAGKAKDWIVSKSGREAIATAGLAYQFAIGQETGFVKKDRSAMKKKMENWEKIRDKQGRLMLGSKDFSDEPGARAEFLGHRAVSDEEAKKLGYNAKKLRKRTIKASRQSMKRKKTKTG